MAFVSIPSGPVKNKSKLVMLSVLVKTSPLLSTSQSTPLTNPHFLISPILQQNFASRKGKNPKEMGVKKPELKNGGGKLKSKCGRRSCTQLWLQIWGQKPQSSLASVTSAAGLQPQQQQLEWTATRHTVGSRITKVAGPQSHNFPMNSWIFTTKEITGSHYLNSNPKFNQMGVFCPKV